MVKYELAHNTYKQTGIVSNEPGPVLMETDTNLSILRDLTLSAAIGHSLVHPLTGVEGITSISTAANAVPAQETLAGMGTAVAYGELHRQKD